MARVVIGHGYTNTRPEGHWQRYLATELRATGHQVFYPQFPNPEAPDAAAWQALLAAETELAGALDESAGELIYIGHSLGGVNWLLAANRQALTAKFDRVLLVAPADPAMLGRIPGFDLDLADPQLAARVAEATASLTLIGSDSDPWSPNGIQRTFAAPLGLIATILPGAKHFSKDDGFGRWQGVIDWVGNPEADLTLR
ncbi:MAG: alpha/beta fold hydrolase [Actinomycetales bacterium]|nr:alpha/beta fold hydrolase [Actinomycetales bacterium]